MMTSGLLVLLLLFVPAQQNPQLTSAKDFFNSGVARLQKADLAGAIVDLTKAIDLNPLYVDALIVRGQCLFVKRDLDGALQDYDKVIELAPNTPGVERIYNNRGVIRQSKGDNVGALKDFERAISLNPNHPDSYNGRGLIRHLNGDLKGASLDYDKAIQLQPNLTSAYVNRGGLRYETDNFAGAKADFSRALELFPNNAMAHIDRGVLHTLTGEIDLALADVKKGFALDPGSVSEKDPGKFTSPFKRLQSFIVSHPANPRAYQARGILRLIQGRQAEAMQDFTKCLELDPKLRSEIDKLMAVSSVSLNYR